jgi:predicted DNA-binding protein with PD1-like motif
MKARVLHEKSAKTHVLIFETGDEVMEGLLSLAREKDLRAAYFSGIGAFRNVELGYFDSEKREYLTFIIDQQVEVLSLIGNTARHEGQPKIHVHVVVGFADGTTRGGHLISARVRPTLELFLVESPGELHRKKDAVTGLLLIE